MNSVPLPKEDLDEYTPWEKLCVDLIGPYKIYRKGKKSLILWCITMIDPATGWFEMREIPSKIADVTANLVDQAWLTRYPLPTVMTFDRGTEFMAEFAKTIKDCYGIKKKGITTRNPQANAIIERIHQTIGNMIRTFDYDNLDEADPWSGILSATMFAVRATYHTTLQATPSQLVFGRATLRSKQTGITFENANGNSSDRTTNARIAHAVNTLTVSATKYYFGTLMRRNTADHLSKGPMSLLPLLRLKMAQFAFAWVR